MKKHSSKLKLKKQEFITQWNIHQKQTQYNALEDPHANYYFITKAAKQRLRDLKSQMKRNHHKSPKTKQYIHQIHSKIKFEFPKIKLPLLNHIQEESQLRKSNRKLSEQFHLKIMTERGHQEHYQSNLNQITTRQDEHIDIKDREQQNVVLKKAHKHKSKKKLKQMRTSKQQIKINHDEFLQFLQKKKCQLLVVDNYEL